MVDALSNAVRRRWRAANDAPDTARRRVGRMPYPNETRAYRTLVDHLATLDGQMSRNAQ